MKENRPQSQVAQDSNPQGRKRRSPVKSASPPGQTYYTVTQVCRRLRIKPHVLRYWEKQFDISFKRNSAGRRVISPPQLEKLDFIRYLLHTQGLTVHGVRRRLASMQPAAPAAAARQEQRELITLIQRDLIALRSLLQSGTSDPPAESDAD